MQLVHKYIINTNHPDWSKFDQQPFVSNHFFIGLRLRSHSHSLKE